MSFNITVEGGKSVRLKTKGKYCDRDIVVTAEGGTEDLNAVLTEQEALITELQDTLRGKAAGGGDPVIEPLEITENGTYTATDGVDGYSPVTVNVPIPNGYIQPSGTKEITENGTHDVAQYASVNVNVAGGSSEYDPSKDYQRVDYIISAEEETYPYIITDFCADNDSGVEVIASFPKLQDRIPMGSREDSNATRFYCCYPLSSTGSYYGFNGGSTLSGSFAVNTKYRCQTNFLCSRMAGIFTPSGDRKSSGIITSTLTTQSGPVSIFGFRYCSTGNVTSKREYKFYGARLSQLFEVVREYIPCYRKSDGVVGVYEKYTGQFLTAETGAFAHGAEIEWEVTA